ncbi:MAG: phosphopyruvate hydratase [Betaproteobacteria bacterium]
MTNTTIRRVLARRVWDSRGRPTVEAEVHTDRGVGRAIAPAGASTLSGEARELRDGGKRLRGLDVSQAVANVNGPIAKALVGLNVADQRAVDQTMIALDGTPDKGRLGANGIVAVSLAAAQAAAQAAQLPLWQHLAQHAPTGKAPRLPLPEVQIFGGGAHAGARVDLQDFLLVAPGARSFAEAIEWTAEVYHAAGARMAARGSVLGVADEGGWWPDFQGNEAAIETLTRAIEDTGLSAPSQVAIALDIASTQFFDGEHYTLKLDGRKLDRQAFADLLISWIDAYPIVSVEDPFSENDIEGMRAFTARCGHRIQIVGDDFLVTDASRIAEAARAGCCNAALLKPNQIGTVSETLAAWRAAQAMGWGAIVSARSGESEDVSIVHLAIGWGVPQLKVGSFARSERMAKWNEALRIEETLGSSAAPFPAPGIYPA